MVLLVLEWGLVLFHSKNIWVVFSSHPAYETCLAMGFHGAQMLEENVFLTSGWFSQPSKRICSLERTDSLVQNRRRSIRMLSEISAMISAFHLMVGQGSETRI